MKNAVVWLLVCMLVLAGCQREAADLSGGKPAEDGDVQTGAAPVEEVFGTVVSRVNWDDAEEFYTGALNRDALTDSSVQHLPVYKFDTLEELEQFKRTFGEMFDLEYSYDESPSFYETVEPYDEAFFEGNTVLLVYITAGSGSYRFGVSSVTGDGSTLCVHVEQVNDPEIGTDDMAGWFATVAVPDSVMAGYTAFDADLNNGKL